MIVQHEDATNKRRNPKRELVESYDNNHGSKSVFFFFLIKMAGKQWIVPEVNKTSSFENQHSSIPLPSTLTKRLF